MTVSLFLSISVYRPILGLLHSTRILHQLGTPGAVRRIFVADHSPIKYTLSNVSTSNFANAGKFFWKSNSYESGIRSGFAVSSVCFFYTPKPQNI